MVHTVCRLGKMQRGRSTVEFYKDGKAQIYCYGVIDMATDEYLSACRTCPDWVKGEQCENDFKVAYAEGRITKYEGE